MIERLQKVLANAGIASRRRAEEMMMQGRVTVNGEVITQLGVKVDPSKSHIKVDGKRIQTEKDTLYVLLNKPKGYITSVSDPEGRPTVMQLIPKIKERLYPVGRLDYYTEGLLLLTNDGLLANKLMHPRFGVEKKYLAKVKGCPTEDQIKKVERGGIALPEGKSADCRIRLIRQGDKNCWLEIILHEGKKREVRRLMAKIGHPVLKLKRVGYAHLKLGTLPIGAHRLLTAGEIAGLQKIILRDPQPLPAAPIPRSPLGLHRLPPTGSRKR